MKSPYISIVIANYNGEKYLPVCLNSVLRSNYKDFELLLVDDGSSDKSLEIIDKFINKDSRITLIKNINNIGAAASRNKGVARVKGEIIIFLDNDTEVSKNWINELISCFDKNDNIGAAQALIMDFNDRKKIQMAGGLLIPQTGWLAAEFHKSELSEVKNKLKVKKIVGISAALAVKKEVMGKIGGFDEKEAIYTEDIDLCWRIWVAGYQVLLVPTAMVYHWTKSVRQRSSMKASYLQIYFHLAKNSLRSIIKNYEPINVFRYLPYSVVINIGRGVLFAITGKGFDALLGSIKGAIWILANLLDTIKARSNVQKNRKYSDGYLMQHIFTHKSLTQVYNDHFKE